MTNLNNIFLNYRVFGEGHPVVFLHGFLESISMWNYLKINNCKAILIDLPGHGKSPIEDNESIASMAEKVIMLLNKLGIDHFSIIGHSMGGYVALEVLNQSAGVKSLCLMHSNFWQDSEDKKRDRERVAEVVKNKKEVFIYEAIPNLFNDPDLFDAQIKLLIDEVKQMSSEAIGICSIAMKNRQNHKVLVEKNQQIISIIQGNTDNVVPVKAMKENLSGINIEYIEIISGHMSHIENTESMNEKLDKWIKKTETN